MVNGLAMLNDYSSYIATPTVIPIWRRSWCSWEMWYEMDWGDRRSHRQKAAIGLLQHSVGNIEIEISHVMHDTLFPIT